MPLVDVNDILVDPDIAGQRFTVIRRQEIVNAFGESTETRQTFAAIGSIQPSGDNAVIREEGFDAQTNTVKVVTKFRLRGPTKGPGTIRYKADIIFVEPFFRNYFEVVSVNDWNAFGAGFIEAEATAIDWMDFPPPE